MKIALPDHVKFIMNKVLSQGHEIYLVGGTVRDYLLNMTTDDFDFASSAIPDQIKSIFREFKIMDYGEQHGTVSIYYKGKLFEITTFREEGVYSDGRRPDQVEFVGDLKTDLSRRDFTINALAVDVNGQLIDYFHGLNDFKHGIIRAVGDPKDRIREDSLRILRAARFSLRLNFKIEDNTYSAIKELADLLTTHAISGERIFTELAEIFLFSNECFMLLDELNILEILFPSVYLESESENLIRDSKKIQKKSILSWALLLYYASSRGQNCETKCSEIFERYPGQSKLNQDILVQLVKSVNYTRSLTKTFTKRRMLRWMMQVVDQLPRKPNFDRTSFYKTLIDFVQLLDETTAFKTISTHVEEHLEMFPIQLPLDGYDIKQMGFKGRTIGSVLDECQRLFLNNKSVSNQEISKHINDLCESHEIMLKTIREFVSNNQPTFMPDEDKEFNDCLMDRISILSRNFQEIHLIGETSEFDQISFDDPFYDNFLFEIDRFGTIDSIQPEQLEQIANGKIILLSNQTDG